jgi:hypothetical protein
MKDDDTSKLPPQKLTDDNIGPVISGFQLRRPWPAALRLPHAVSLVWAVRITLCRHHWVGMTHGLRKRPRDADDEPTDLESSQDTLWARCYVEPPLLSQSASTVYMSVERRRPCRLTRNVAASCAGARMTLVGPSVRKCETLRST